MAGSSGRSLFSLYAQSRGLTLYFHEVYTLFITRIALPRTWRLLWSTTTHIHAQYCVYRQGSSGDDNIGVFLTHSWIHSSEHGLNVGTIGGSHLQSYKKESRWCIQRLQFIHVLYTPSPIFCLPAFSLFPKSTNIRAVEDGGEWRTSTGREHMMRFPSMSTVDQLKVSRRVSTA